MRVLLDESVPRALGGELVGHDWSTVPRMGWSGLVNGVLLGVAVAADFEVLLTCDRNMQQQNMPALGLALQVIAVSNIALETIRPLASEILTVLDSQPQPGTISLVGTWRI